SVRFFLGYIQLADQKSNSGTENAVGWIILLGVLGALFLLFWYFQEFAVKDAFRWMRWGQMWLISFFVDGDYTVAFRQYDVNFQQWLDGVPDIPKEKLDDRTMHVIGTLTMAPLKLIIAALIGFMGVWVAMYGPGTNYRRKLNLDGL